MVGIFGISALQTRYPHSMISYKKTDALHPEKESVFGLNLLPLLIFLLGYLLTRSVIGNIKVPQAGSDE